MSLSDGADIKSITHHEVGVLEFRCEVLLTPDDDVSLIVLFPLERTGTVEKLELLAVVDTQRLTTG